MTALRLMVCDDDVFLHRALRLSLAQWFEVHSSTSAAELLDALKAQTCDLVLLDLNLNDAHDGFWVLHQVRLRHPGVCVVVHSGSIDCGSVVKAMRLGACDYVAKGSDMLELKQSLLHALTKMPNPPSPVPQVEAEDFLMSQNAAYLKTLAAAERFRQFPGNVLICGEPGVGKESLARRVHRGDGPFVTVDAASIADVGVDSTLFGHECGAFLGADRTRLGIFEEADGGTLFIDEVANLSPLVQAKLLRMLQTQQVRRLGSNRLLNLSLRVVAATHRDLGAMAQADTFRSDLYSRLAVLCLDVPPLRERHDDIPGLLDHHLQRFKGPGRTELPPAVVDAYRHYAWPGNIRELANTVQYMLAMAGGSLPTLADLPRSMQREPPPVPTAELSEQGSYREQVRQFETQLLHQTYAQTAGRVSLMSKRLGLDRSYLYAKLKALGILTARQADPAIADPCD